MKAITHQRAGLFLGLTTHPLFISDMMTDANVFSQAFMIGMFALSATVGALLADIDMTDSQMGMFFPGISKFISKTFKHRRATHSLLTLAIFILALQNSHRLNIAADFFELIVLGLMIGHISHILLDLITPAGIALLYPIKKKVSLGTFKSDGVGEILLNQIFLIGNALIIVYLIYSIFFT